MNSVLRELLAQADPTNPKAADAIMQLGLLLELTYRPSDSRMPDGRSVYEANLPPEIRNMRLTLHEEQAVVAYIAELIRKYRGQRVSLLSVLAMGRPELSIVPLLELLHNPPPDCDDESTNQLLRALDHALLYEVKGGRRRLTRPIAEHIYESDTVALLRKMANSTKQVVAEAAQDTLEGLLWRDGAAEDKRLGRRRTGQKAHRRRKRGD